MPNLKQILALKKQYSELNEDEIKTQNYLEARELKSRLNKLRRVDFLNESDDTKLFSFLNEAINLEESTLIQYFENAKEVEVVLLFIDITAFSKTIKGWENKKLKTFLDNYYRKVIPIIYKNKGQIEKLMGDGIVCVFGPPFINSQNYNYVFHAEQCAEDVIKEFYNTNMSVKVAIHKGRINYYKVPGDDYAEYTMIGNTITELFRLESISISNSINFYGNSNYDKLGFPLSIFKENIMIGAEVKISPLLSGVDYSLHKYMQFPGYL